METEGPSLVIAGAGSGKTRVLTYRIAQLLSEGVHPAKILALTFTNKAAREMQNRIDRLLGNDVSRDLWMGTFHSIFSSILRREADYIGFTKDYTIYDEQDSKNLIKFLIKEMKLNDKEYNVSVVANRISSAKDKAITADDYLDSKELTEEDAAKNLPRIGDIYKLYERRCAVSNIMDFDDLLLKTLLLFRAEPEVRERYQDLFSYILVDEFQDTNLVQYLILKILAEKSRNLCVVGDDAQSIYSFRGARIDNILSFKDDYPDCKEFKLERNYRSSSTIVEAANGLIVKNTRQIPKSLYSENGEGFKIRFIEMMSDREEAAGVAAEIKSIALSTKSSYRSFAILYRTNAQSRLFEEALRRSNIPYLVYGSISFYQRSEVKDIVAFLRLTVNNNDEEALRRAIKILGEGIGPTTVKRLSDYALRNDMPMWSVIYDLERIDGLGITPGFVKRVAKFRDMILSLSTMSIECDAYETATTIMELSGLNTLFEADDTPEGISRKENKEELLNSIKEFTESAHENGTDDRLASYVANVQLLTDQDKRSNMRDYVSIMTVHAAKGLEFDNLFVTGLEEDLFPSIKSMKSQADLEEERRLFYVAITRAKQRLYLTSAKMRMMAGSMNYTRCSRFVGEIPNHCLKGERISFTPREESPRRDEFSRREGYPRREFPYGGTSRRESPRGGSSFRKSPHRETLAPNRGVPIIPKRSQMLDTSFMEALNPSDVVVGMRVAHRTFGYGKVIEVSGRGDETRAKIDFQAGGVRVLLLSYGKLHRA